MGYANVNFKDPKNSQIQVNVVTNMKYYVIKKISEEIIDITNNENQETITTEQYDVIEKPFWKLVRREVIRIEMCVILTLFLFLPIKSAGQEKEYFLDNLKLIYLPIIVDNNYFNNYQKFKTVNYEDLKQVFDDSNDLYYLSNISPDGIYHLSDKFNVGRYLGVLLFFNEKENSYNADTCFLLLLNQNHKLHSFKSVAWKVKNHNEIGLKLCYISSEYIIEYDPVSDDLNKYVYNDDTTYYPFSNTDLPMPLKDTVVLPNLDFNEFDLNKFIFDEYKYYFPIKYLFVQVKDVSFNSNSFFLFSRKILQKRKIIFQLRYNSSKEWKKNIEVYYSIIDINNNILNEKLIGYYRQDLIGKEMLSSSFVQKDNDKIIINFNGNIEIIQY